MAAALDGGSWWVPRFAGYFGSPPIRSGCPSRRVAGQLLLASDLIVLAALFAQLRSA